MEVLTWILPLEDETAYEDWDSNIEGGMRLPLYSAGIGSKPGTDYKSSIGDERVCSDGDRTVTVSLESTFHLVDRRQGHIQRGQVLLRAAASRKEQARQLPAQVDAGRHREHQLPEPVDLRPAPGARVQPDVVHRRPAGPYLPAAGPGTASRQRRPKLDALRSGNLTFRYLPFNSLGEASYFESHGWPLFYNEVVELGYTSKTWGPL